MKVAATIALFASLYSTSVLAQQNPCLRQTIHLDAFTRTGRIVAGLDKSKFVASHDHRPVLIRSVVENSGARRVFILIDASESMQALRNLSFNVAEAVLKGLPPGSQIAFLVFATKPVGASAFSTNREELGKQLESLRTDRHLQKRIKGRTALLNAFQEALTSFEEPHEGDSFYVISDGQDTASEVDWHRVDRELVRYGIRVFALRVQWTGVEATIGYDHLQDIIGSTGGYAVVLPLDFVRYAGLTFDLPLRDARGNPTHLATEIGLQLRLIQHVVQMRVQFPEEPLQPRRWQLSFRNSEDTKNLVLTYQHTPLPCGK